MSSKNVPEVAPGSVLDVDPVALGRAGMDALAIAGTAVLAHYARTDPFDPTDSTVQPGCSDLARLCATPDLPEEVGRVLANALGAFGAAPTWAAIRTVATHGDAESDASMAAALTAMSQRALDVAARRSFALDTVTTERVPKQGGDPAGDHGEARIRSRGRPSGRGWRRQSGGVES